MELHRVCALVVLCLTAQDLSAQMYKWVDEKGQFNFSDQPPPKKNSPTPLTTPAQANRSADNDRVKNVQADIRTHISEPAAYPPSITLQIRALLLERKFNDLNHRLADYHAATIVDIGNERDLITAYNAFSSTGPSIEQLIEEWVTTTPDDYQPYLARAMYNRSKGWDARGGKWASETEKKQFDEMNAYFKSASDDLAVVLEKNKQVIVSYYALINVMRTTADNKGILQVLQAAIVVNPNTYYVRRMAMYSLTPRWGGSFELMQAIAAEAKQHSANNPHLKQLEGQVYAEAGAMNKSNRMYNEANELYNKALEFGEEEKALSDRSYNNYKREHYSEALVDINRAIELYHDDASYYYRRARILWKLENYTRAIEDINRAIELEPADKDYIEYKEWIARQLTSSGYKQYKNRDTAASIITYNTALQANPNDANLYYRRARSLIDQNKFDPAITDTKKAISLAPDEYDYYLLLDWLLVKQRDWDQIIDYWDQYIARNPDNSRAYVERGGAYYHKGDLRSAVNDAKTAADMGNVEGKEAYEKFKGRLR